MPRPCSYVEASSKKNVQCTHLRLGETAMRNFSSRWLAFGLLTSAGAGVLGLTSMMTAAFAFGDDVALITPGAEGIGGATTTSSSDFTQDVYDLYINPTQSPLPFDGQPTFPDYSPVTLDLPALDGLTTSDAISQATSELNTALTQTYAGDNIVDVTYSESTIAATQEMIALDAEQGQTGVPSPSDLSFVMLGDLNNPNGGILERLSPLNPGIDYFTATPSDTPYPTDIYTIQYDGVADFPQYADDIPADLNAMMGYSTAHLEYSTLTPAELATAVQEPTSPDYYTDGGVTDYFMIPTQDLPLLDPIRDIPGIGPALADLMQPDMRVLVDMGYGDGYANVATPLSFSEPDYNWTAIDDDLVLGMQQGITAAEVDMGSLPTSDLPDAYPYLPYVPGDTTVPNPDLISSDPASSSESLQSLFSGLDTLSLNSDLTALTTDLSGALSQLGPEFASFGLDPSLFLSLF
jgi:diacyltrehalose acyltransferase